MGPIQSSINNAIGTTAIGVRLYQSSPTYQKREEKKEFQKGALRYKNKLNYIMKERDKVGFTALFNKIPEDVAEQTQHALAEEYKNTYAEAAQYFKEKGHTESFLKAQKALEYSKYAQDIKSFQKEQVALQKQRLEEEREYEEMMNDPDYQQFLYDQYVLEHGEVVKEESK